MDFAEFMKKLNNEFPDKSKRGFQFEKKMCTYLLVDPVFADEIKKIYRWNEFPEKKQFSDGHDIGIDLVIKDKKEKYWAVQCKCYDSSTTIDKKQVDTFIATSGKSFVINDTIVGFEKRIWISTSDNLTKHANECLNNQRPSVIRINRTALENSGVNWDIIYNGGSVSLAKPQKFELNFYQKEAFKNALEHYKNHDRGRLSMACGTGKTLTSLKIVEAIAVDNNLVLFCVPSITLVAQTFRQWINQCMRKLNKICVCSDQDVSRIGFSDSDHILDSVNDIPYPATTDPMQLYETYCELNKSNLTCIFTTYQSIDVICKAQKLGLPEFDIIICDEAHRTAGIMGSNDANISAFIKVHDNEIVKGRLRLYMTATPRLYSPAVKARTEYKDSLLCSMDDVSIYGEEFYKLSFRRAVEAGLLCDYKVVVLTIREDSREFISLKRYYDVDALVKERGTELLKKEFQAFVKLIGSRNALSKKLDCDDSLNRDDPGPMLKAVAYCESINMSKGIMKLHERFIKKINNEKGDIVDIDCKQIDGTMSSNKREEMLSWLKKESEPDRKKCKILTNVRCLSEGVDLPSLDAIIFLSGKDSQTEVVQSVGRVMRRAAGKKFGYIIIPMIVPKGMSAEEAIAKSEEYKVINNVIAALRSHDENMVSTIIQMASNKQKPSKVIIGGVPLDDDLDPQLNLDAVLNKCSTEDLTRVIFAKLVESFNLKLYWTSWAVDVANIAKKHIEELTKIASNGESKKRFTDFLEKLKRSTNNPNLKMPEIIEMLAQHKITEPVFNALFKNYEFAKHNPISKDLNNFLNKLPEHIESEDKKILEKFYESVKQRVSIIDNQKARQNVIIELYNTFFKIAFPEMARELGIVYTPIEIVDFILKSVNDILYKEFGLKLTNEKVNILDPFTGTGTFIVRLLQSGLIKNDDLQRKYNKELFAYEIVLLAYYIASVNIESVYHALLNTNEYKEFEGICLTDTFQFNGCAEKKMLIESENEMRLEKHLAQQITVIVGNPPYSIHGSSDSAAHKLKYEKLDKKIKETYIRDSQSVNIKSMYDSYIRAYRWAHDRIGDNNGVIGFVTNSSWLTSISNNGLRKCFEEEFYKIYIFDLRGDKRTTGEKSRREGRNVFDDGSRTPVAITILVKKEGFRGRAEIYYADIGEYLKTNEKLEKIRMANSLLSETMPRLILLNPKEAGEWFLKKSRLFHKLHLLMPDKTPSGVTEDSIFSSYSLGVITSRDAWVYDFSEKNLIKKAKNTIDSYNEQIKTGILVNDPKKISWSRELYSVANRKIKLEFNSTLIRKAMYRPFVRKFLYYSKELVDSTRMFNSYFPTKEAKNIIICISGQASKNDFSVFITDSIVDFHTLSSTRCVPLYYYNHCDLLTNDEASSGWHDYNNEKTFSREDGISDNFVRIVEFKYNQKISRETIFYYIYGFLHSNEYKSLFRDDLKLSMPRLPLVDLVEDFLRFSKAGRELADLHLNYENVEPLDYVNVVIKNENYKLEKMTFKNANKKEIIVFNKDITIENIPSIAYEYVLKGMSAIEHIMLQYQIKQDKASGIITDPNEDVLGGKDSKHILELLLSVISVSVKTVEIVKKLPKLNLKNLEDLE